ncbi:MAG: hypothetical protein PHH85_01940 [Candidatus Methanoperedens sp.]|nr:hypothetical protein [Candidatus Methanoperedens sp.]
MANAVLIKIDDGVGSASGDMTLSCYVVFSGPDVPGHSDSTYVNVEVDPTMPAADVENVIVAAVRAEAARFGYNLLAANIVMPTLKKGA